VGRGHRALDGAVGKLRAYEFGEVRSFHLEDEVGLILHAAEREEVRGPLNATAPEPVTNEEFTQALGAVLRRPTLLRIPAFALRLALGEAATVLLSSQRVYPVRALETGYRFLYPDLRPALAAILRPGVPGGQ